MPTTVVSFRIKPEELAKALEGLLNTNIKPDLFTTISSIVRMTFYHGLIYLCENPDEPAHNDAMQKINQLLNQGKRTKSVSIKELLQGD